MSALTWLLEEWDPDKEYTELELRKLRCFEASMVISFMRPFTKSRNGTTLSKKSIGIKLNENDKLLFQKVDSVRNDFIAHSDEEKMDFRIRAFELDDPKNLFVPKTFYEYSLHFNYEELRSLESLLGSLLTAVISTVWDLSQRHPKQMEFIKKPNR